MNRIKVDKEEKSTTQQSNFSLLDKQKIFLFTEYKDSLETLLDIYWKISKKETFPNYLIL